MIIVGLTGSIGMGKTTTAAMFAEEGAAVFDSDAAVHALYAAGGAATAPLNARFPGVLTETGAVDRVALRERLQEDAQGFRDLEAIVHPLVGAAREAFLAQAEAEGRAVAILDVPLLFETSGDAHVDCVVVVSAPLDIQRQRVLARPGMTEDALQSILARQTPDAQKRDRADYVVETGEGLAPTRASVKRIMAELTAQAKAQIQGKATS